MEIKKFTCAWCNKKNKVSYSVNFLSVVECTKCKQLVVILSEKDVYKFEDLKSKQKRLIP